MKYLESVKQKAHLYRGYTAQNLSQLVKIPSPCGDEKRVISALEHMCREAGFDEVRVDGLGNLIGRVGGGERVIVFDAHVDTVGPGDRSQWENDPFSGEIRDGAVHGRGSVDQKGGAASMVTAARILKELQYDGIFSIYFTFTVLEEDCEGLCWNYIIEKEKIHPEFAVITEPTNLGIYRGHRGRMELDLDFSGVSSHGSAPQRGDNAIYKGARAALAVSELNQRLAEDLFLGKGTVAVTKIASDSPSLCSVPDRCTLHLDRRLTWGETIDSAVGEVSEIAGKDAEITVPEFRQKSYRGVLFPQKAYFPTWKIAEDHVLVQAGVRTFVLLFRKEPEKGKWLFSTNGVSICGTHGIPSIGFGPGDERGAHAPNEKVPVAHLHTASAFYALLPYILEAAL